MPERPNLLIILSDDHGYGDRSALGHSDDVRTPHLDRLAAQGVSCTDGYVTAPVCSPSRAGLMAGQYQARWGAHYFGDSEFGDHTPSLAEQFRQLGYRTGYFGKVHYGTEDVGDRAAPPHHGFQTTYYGLAGQQTGRLNYLRHSRAAVEEYGPLATRVSAVQPMLEGDAEVELDGFLTEELGRRTRDFIADAGDQPWFGFLAFNAVHNFCWQLPPEELERRGLPAVTDYTGDEPEDYSQWYDGMVAPNLPHGRDYYLAQLELMDAEIGRVLDLVEGGDRETIVVYLTDNGGSSCNYGDNTPLRGTKYTLWEGGIRVPFLIRWPGVVEPGSTVRTPVSALDLYPTLLAAAGAAPELHQHSDGVDLREVLTAGAVPARSLHWDVGFSWAVRSGDWKLVHFDADSRELAHLVSYERAAGGSGTSLFDLAADPSETTDLLDSEPERAAQLRAEHEWFRTEVDGSAVRAGLVACPAERRAARPR